MKQTAFRLTDEDLAIIDTAKEYLGYADRTETVRYLLRQWVGAAAVLERLAVERAKAKDKKAKR